MEDIDKKDKEEERNEAKKDKDDDEDEESHALFLKEKTGRTGIQILTQKEVNDQKNQTAAPVAAVTNATVVTSSPSATEDKAKEDKAGKFERFMKATKKKQQDAKNLADASSNSDHQFQNKANEVPGSSQNWNGTKKGDEATELTIVQDFHQVKSIPGSDGNAQ